MSEQTPQSPEAETPRAQPSQQSQTPQPPEPPEPQRPSKSGNDFIAAQLSSAQTLMTVALIAGPVSLIIGGVFLSVAALVCAAVGLSKINAARRAGDDMADMAARLARQAKVAIAISIVAAILNVIAFVLMFPLVMEYLQTGDLSQLLAGATLDEGSVASDSSSSVWG